MEKGVRAVMKVRTRYSVIIIFLLMCAIVISFGNYHAYADTTDSSVYGGGNYGNCDYGTCTITLNSGGTTNIDIIPTASSTCTVQSDTASVLTDSGSGYTLTMATSTTDNSLIGSSSSIAASSGTLASPGTLAANTWGYRVDGIGGFGTGPTSAQTNGSTPSLSFAGVPTSNQPGATIASSSSPANPAEDTTIWYGVCANSTLQAGTYTGTVVYSAVVN